ncbi:hypothetical protein SUGI_0462610 [Cryptomeria japonica]|nr:hypothetical protein SUGI_0462610 [Cryptomeria japonica]
MLQTQKHSGMLIRFVIWVCLVGFTAAKCVPENCGSMNVSYPFWINNSHCGYPGFQINCTQDEDTGIMALFIRVLKGNNESSPAPDYYKIREIDYMGHLTVNSTSLKSSLCETNTKILLFTLPKEGPFTISISNKFVGIGCNTFAIYTYQEFGRAQCETICNSQIDEPSDEPYCRYGCCELNLLYNWRWINFTGGNLFGLQDSTTNVSSTVCGFSTIFDPSTFTVVDNNTNLFWGEGMKADYGLRLKWGIGQGRCSKAIGTANYSCSINAECIDSPSEEGYVCKCLPRYEGNGYSNGTDCKDIDECSDKKSNLCVGAEAGGKCHNLAGSYNCSCEKGYEGDGFQNGTGCVSKNSNHFVIPVIIGSVSSFMVVCLGASIVVWWLKKRHLKLVEAKYFQRLQQYIATRVGRESPRMFSAKELARASNNYSKEMVLESGGFGTVFKGILLDGTLVAIKKSKEALNLEDDHEFLNENLFRMEHFFNIYTPKRGVLQIAIETAEALAYLHSGASQPIFHRDVKSSNILLNERLSPKVADFGISRLISTSNNTHLTTNIMGTRGYLDPEYFQTYQLTDKSDVYSFGVVLIELITGLVPLSVERASEEWSLSSLFLARINHNRLREILDSKVLEEESQQQMEDIGRLARECLHLERRKRPSMKEVVEQLLWVRGGTRKKKIHDNAIFEEGSIS